MTKNGDWKWAAKTLLIGMVGGAVLWLGWLTVMMIDMSQDIAEIKASMQVRVADKDGGRGQFHFGVSGITTRKE